MAANTVLDHKNNLTEVYQKTLIFEQINCLLYMQRA